MTNRLTAEQRALGRLNAQSAIGTLPGGPRAGHASRRDFLRAAGAAGAGLGAMYFGYGPMGDKKAVKAAIIGTGNEGCGAMIHDHNRDYVDFIGFCDIRPSQVARATAEFAKHPQYSPEDVDKLRQYDDYQKMLADPDVEMVVIALPLWLHAPIAIAAMEAGKHVFCEKLMAHTVTECKQMCRVARAKNRVLAIGHQRHYSALYDNANAIVTSGALGEIRHIRALWHRNNGQPVIEKGPDGKLQYDSQGNPIYKRDDQGNVAYYDSWKPEIPTADRAVDYRKHSYRSLDELVRWRLYDRTGAGLMAELGSHQLDACSIFLGKKHPVAVTGFGGNFYYPDHREVDDHVFVNFEFPLKVDDQGAPDGFERVVVSYSSITTNAFEKYGEELYGTYGTMIVEEERDILLYKENDRNASKATPPLATSITIEKAGSKPVLETSPSGAGPTPAAAIGALAGGSDYPPSRGYREELEHFAYCIRHGDASDYHADPDHQPRCRGEVALADAVIALTSNLAMRQKRRIEFDPAWFDATSDAAPDAAGPIARRS